MTCLQIPEQHKQHTSKHKGLRVVLQPVLETLPLMEKTVTNQGFGVI